MTDVSLADDAFSQAASILGHCELVERCIGSAGLLNIPKFSNTIISSLVHVNLELIGVINKVTVDVISDEQIELG